jgi:regulator of RNase E activity RraA
LTAVSAQGSAPPTPFRGEPNRWLCRSRSRPRQGLRGIAFAAPVVLCILLGIGPALAQVGVFTRDHLVQYSPDWKGERFPDGRPKVADDLLQRMKAVSIEEAWAVLRRHGFNQQFEGNWVLAGPKEPALVGRAVTACFAPTRPDVNEVIKQTGEKEGRIGGQNSWVIDTLVKGDVIVVDLMGKVIDGTFMGDNLANSIWSKTGGTGVVIHGGARDIEGVEQIPNFPVFNRGWDPSAIADVMLMGINTPIRIGRAAVMPGDVVLGKKEGIIFIPAHLAQEVVETSEIIRVRDQFGHQRLREGKYTPGQIDRKWSDEIENDFTEWLKTRGQELTPYQREKLLKGRTW